MKIKEVVDKILAYHPDFGPDYHGCDEYKCGNPEDECTGIVTALVPTVNVIRKAIELNANLIIVHEPIFYTSLDKGGWYQDFENEVYNEKRKLIDDHHICIWRDHDHLHAHNPDGIFTGTMKYYGFGDNYEVISDGHMFSSFVVRFEEKTLGELCEFFSKKIPLNGVRVIGNLEQKVSSMAFIGHLYPMGDLNDEYSVKMIKIAQMVDVVIPGETIDWTLLSYIRDAVELGKNKAMISIGHFNGEELGSKYMKDWLGDLIDHQVEITYVPSGDMYNYYVNKE